MPRAQPAAGGAAPTTEAPHGPVRPASGTTQPREARAAGAQPRRRRHHHAQEELEADAREADIKGRSKMSKEELADALQRYNDRQAAARSR